MASMKSPLQPLALDANAQPTGNSPATKPTPPQEKLKPGTYVFSPEDGAVPCDSDADTEAGSPADANAEVRVPKTMFKKMYTDSQSNAAPVVPETPGTKTRNWIAELKAQGEMAAAQCGRMGAVAESCSEGEACGTPAAPSAPSAAINDAASSSTPAPSCGDAINAAATVSTAVSPPAVPPTAAMAAAAEASSSSSGGGGGSSSNSSSSSSGEELSAQRLALEQAHAAKLGELRGSLHSQHAMEIHLVEGRAAAALAKEKEASRQREVAAGAEAKSLQVQLNAASAAQLEAERRAGAEIHALKAAVAELEAKRGRLEGATQYSSEQNTELRASLVQREAELTASAAQVSTLEGAVRKRDAALEAKEAQRIEDVAAMKALLRAEAESMMSKGNTRYRELQGHYKRKKAAFEECAPKLKAAEAAVVHGAAELAKVKAKAESASTELKAAQRELEELRPRLADQSAVARAAEAKASSLAAQLKEQAAAAAAATTDGAAAAAAATESAKAQTALESEKNTLKVRIFDATQRNGELEADLAESRKKEKELEAICEELMALAEANKTA